MSEWQPIDTAPKDGTAVWLLIDGHPYLGYCEPADWLNENERWFAKATFIRRSSPRDGRATPTTDDIHGCYGIDMQPTLWMPLPAPPKRS